MHMSECGESFRSRRIVDFNRRCSSSGEEEAATKDKSSDKIQIEAATRLQIFLDRANFSPGRIDGGYNDLTWKAMALYRESQGEQPQAPPSQSGAQAKVPPDVSGLDLASVEPVFVPYTVTEADLQRVGRLPRQRSCEGKAEVSALP